MTVNQVQCLLEYLGYEPGAVDGVDGPNTRDAIRAFQKAEGLTADGIAGAQTQAMLREAVFQGRVYSAPDAGSSNGNAPSWWADIRYFKRSEPYIACSCGQCGGFPVEPSERLMRLADAVREAAGKPMIPTSTVRCAEHNAAVRGVKTSRHLLGNAMDFYIPGMSADQILAIVRQQENVAYCYAIDYTTVHMDIGD